MPIVSLGDAYSHDDGWKGNLADTIAQGTEPQSDDQIIIQAIRAERPFMSEIEAAADWMIGVLSSADARSLAQFADDEGISKGYASKLRVQIAKKNQEAARRKIIFGNQETLAKSPSYIGERQEGLTHMDTIAARSLGGVFIALCNALSPKGAEIACDTLRGFADNPDTRPEDRFIYKTIANAASRPIDELAQEVEQFENERPRFEVITGGAA